MKMNDLKFHIRIHLLNLTDNKTTPELEDSLLAIMNFVTNYVESLHEMYAMHCKYKQNKENKDG